jgi:hypothetical protein
MTACQITVIGLVLAILHLVLRHWRRWFYCGRTCSCGKSCDKCKSRWDSFRDLDWKRDKSPLLFIVAFFLFVLRRLSLWENLKHCFPKTSPWGLELYLLCWWGIVLSIPWWGKWLDNPPTCFRWIALFVVVQLVQTNFYHEFWRTLGEGLTKEEMNERKVFNRMRNLIIAFLNIVFVNQLFGAFYWWSRSSADGTANFDVKLETIYDAFYFSAVTGSTTGYGDIKPVLGAGLVQAVVVCHVFTSLFLVAVVLSMVVGAIDPLPQKSTAKSDETD